MPIVVLAFGGRHFRDREAMFAALDVIHAVRGIGNVIHGGAPGADQLAGEWADARGIPVHVEVAEWEKYGPSAGPRRNGIMAAMQPDLGLEAPGNRGTADMRGKLIARGIKVVTIREVLEWKERNNHDSR